MLNDLKLMLDIRETDEQTDARLQWIIDSVTTRLLSLINEDDLPPRLEPIVIEVSIIRYNRIGSEGVGSHSVEGESMTFGDKDFEPYMDEIQTYINKSKETARGRVRFI